MNRRLLEVLGRLLEPDEREAVLGDLAESDKSAYYSVRDLAGLIIRRHSRAWKHPGAWLVLLALVVPVGILININAGHLTDNVAFQTWKYANHVRRNTEAFYWIPFVVNCAELACWSWAASVVIGTLGRRTSRVNALLFWLLCAIGTLVYGPPFLPSQNPLAMWVACVAVQLTIQGCLVLLPSIAGTRDKAGITIHVLCAATLALMPIYEEIGFFLNAHRFYEGVIHLTDGPCFVMLWPILYWLSQAFQKRRVTA